MSKFLDLLKERIIVFDGAMGTNLQVQNLTMEDYGGAQFEGCPEYLLISKPDAIAKVHTDFLDAGCDVIETNSFGATPHVLAEYQIPEMAYDLNVKAAQLAKQLANDYSTAAKPRFVAGSMGPGTKLPTLGHISFKDLKAAYDVQVRGLIDGGADLLIVETCQDLLQIKAALGAIFDYFAAHKIRLPVITQVTIETFGTMLNGTEISAALTSLEPFPIDVIGMNCGTGPKNMPEYLRYLCDNAPLPVSVLPNAGMPEVLNGKMHYDETPETFTAQIVDFAVNYGANVVGGCCGTTPAHLQAVVAAMQNLAPKKRDAKLVPSASSIFSQQPYNQDNSFLIIGERVNASGSKKMRDLLDNENWDGLVSLAREQEKEGAHILDVNVDFVGRDGEKDMHELVSRLVTNVKIPLMLDSTEWEKMAAGLEHAGGKCILNSTNYEDGDERYFKVLELARQFGAAIVVGTIDEDGMARTADGKIKIAKRAFDDATAYGIEAHDIFFDPLALPISTGIEEDRSNAANTIESIRRIRAELPETNILLGVSNISFGLNPAARVVLNSIFLHECTVAGMNAAIVNASKILPLNRFNEREIEVALDLIYDRRKFAAETNGSEICVYDPLTEFTTLFQGKTAQSMKVDVTNLPIEDKLKHHVIDGEKIGLEDNLKLALNDYAALEIVNDILLDGMKTVGDLFGSGQMQLPFVLQSAEVMKTAVKFLEPFMEKVEGEQSKGVMVLATVKGDVHDIGKNLVDIILTNNGYRVVNLGIKQSVEAILDAYKEHNADAIGMSGLLVKSTLIMRDNLEIMNARGINVPVVLGGAALTRKYAVQDLQPLYNGKLFYAQDAFDGLHTMDSLMQKGEPSAVNGERKNGKDAAPRVPNGSGNKIDVAADDAAEGLDAEDLVGEEAKLGIKNAATPRGVIGKSGDFTHTTRSDVSQDVEIPVPPFYGSRVIENIDLDEIFGFVNETALFKGQWQYKQGKTSKEDYRKLLDAKVYPAYNELKLRSKNENLLQPKVVYGYFPCQSAGNDLIVYSDDLKTERLRFEFPRQPLSQRGSKNLCLADYFASVESGKMDVVAFDLVTMGHRASEYAAELFAADNYTEYLLFHGLSVEAAEALAEMWHKRIRTELGIAGNDAPQLAKLFHQGYQGSRYSFGYPACPNLEDQAKIFELIQPELIGVELSEEFQLEPEQSTSAIVLHHPEAKYFNIE